MLKVQFKIMPKPRGNFMPRLEAFRQYIESVDLTLNPRFTFRKEYKLPGRIYLCRGKEELKCGDNVCTLITTLQFEIDCYITQPAQTSNIKAFLNNRACGSTCTNCRAFLEWRPGAKPDYSDFVAVFELASQDMMEAWQKAVADAMNSGENDEVDIVFASDSYKQVRVEEELKTKPTRKLKVF